jgi:FtsP/CotA-like multicopper oxidase with cupredoxin domain
MKLSDPDYCKRQAREVSAYSFEGMLYNGFYLPPLLRARTGDVLRIAFRNGLPNDSSNCIFTA